jgi:hypothetical protein
VRRSGAGRELDWWRNDARPETEGTWMMASRAIAAGRNADKDTRRGADASLKCLFYETFRYRKMLRAEPPGRRLHVDCHFLNHAFTVRILTIPIPRVVQLLPASYAPALKSEYPEHNP